MGLPALVWVVLALFGGLDGYALAAAFAVLVAFPVALAIDASTPRWLARFAWVAGPIAAGSLLLDRGPLAAGIASVWVLVTLLHLVHGAIRFLNAPSYRSPAPWAEAASAAGPVVAAVALVWSRFDGTFAGFPEPLATLTVPHFHFTFGLLPVALAALARAGRLRPLPLWGVVFAPPLIGALFALRPTLLVPSLAEAAVIGVLALSIGALPFTLRGSPARAAAVLLAVCTFIAAWFATGLALGRPTVDFAWMLRWHGVGNALATVALGWYAARVAPFQGAAAVTPSPALDAPTRDVALEQAFFKDHRDFDLGADTPGRFDALGDALLRYHFYPAHVMRHATTFEGRHAAPGDRIGMTLLVDLFPGYAPIALPATTEVFVATRAENEVSFGYVTTERHYGKGRWQATLRRADGRIRLTIQSRMTPLHPLALAGLPIYRWYQKRAHRLGAENLGRAGGH